MNKMMSVGKCANGFMVEVCVPLKKDMKPSAKTDACCCSVSGSSSVEKQYIAKDAKEVADLIADIMPLLDKDFKTESEFDSAFDSAVNDVETKGED